MHQPVSAHDPSAERLTQRLVAKAHPQNGQAIVEMTDERNTDAGIGRHARAGRNHNSVGLEPLDLRNGDLVVAAHLRLGPQLTQVLDEVVGERVVIIENEDHALG